MTGLTVSDLNDFLSLVLRDLPLDITFVVTIQVTDATRRFHAEFSGPDVHHLTAGDGALLLSLEHLAAMKFRLQPGQYEGLSFDAAGFKNARRLKVGREAQRALTRTLMEGQNYHCARLNYRERLMLHQALAGYGLLTQLIGTGPERHLVVHAPPLSELSRPLSPSATR
jgi:predicted RNA-binding protein Jag